MILLERMFYFRWCFPIKYSTGLLENFVYTVYKNIGVSNATQLYLFAIA